MMQIEICCGSYEDCLAAEKGGAKRVELNSALHLGGLTPSVASLRFAKKNTKLKVITMVRPRSAGFCYSAEDVEVMLLDAQILLENGADGIAFGFLNDDCTIDVVNTQKMIKLIHAYNEKEIVFHRAYDCVKNPYEAMEQLIGLGIDRVLTSGLENKAIEGKELLKQLQMKYGKQIEILAGSGINHTNAKKFVGETEIKQIHSSCKDWLVDNTTTSNRVSYAYHEANDYEVVSSEKVRQLVNLF